MLVEQFMHPSIHGVEGGPACVLALADDGCQPRGILEERSAESRAWSDASRNARQAWFRSLRMACVIPPATMAAPMAFARSAASLPRPSCPYTLARMFQQRTQDRVCRAHGVGRDFVQVGILPVLDAVQGERHAAHHSNVLAQVRGEVWR